MIIQSFLFNHYFRFGTCCWSWLSGLQEMYQTAGLIYFCSLVKVIFFHCSFICCFLTYIKCYLCFVIGGKPNWLWTNVCIFDDTEIEEDILQDVLLTARGQNEGTVWWLSLFYKTNLGLFFSFCVFPNFCHQMQQAASATVIYHLNLTKPLNVVPRNLRQQMTPWLRQKR